jgi:hypothetical protein
VTDALLSVTRLYAQPGGGARLTQRTSVRTLGN